MSYRNQLFKSKRKLPPSFRGLPPPAFLVPAILDTLRYSKYAAFTTLVPEEADVSCARAARNSGGIILTSDSDMLVYDLGPHGGVAFLSDVQLTGEELIGRQMAFSEILKMSIWRPDAIADRLGLPNLRRFAFEISQDPYLTVTAAVQRAKKPAKNVDEFQKFVEEYETDSITLGLVPRKYENLEMVMSQYQLFDPRVSVFPISCPPYCCFSGSFEKHLGTQRRAFSPSTIRLASKAS